MDGSRIKKYDARQLFTWASVAAFFLLLGIQLFVFSEDGEIIGRAPAEVRTAREKLRALDEARQAFARLGTVNLASIPDRDYGAIDPKTLAAQAEATEDVEDMEYDSSPEDVVVAPVEIVPPPVLKGIIQTRDASGQVTLRASYPQRIVVEGESIAGYLVQQITIERVTLVKNGETVVQQVAESHLTRKR